jgi:DNA-binding PadR family transcriptional regulator
MSLTHALLGVLTARPMSGYDLLRYVDVSVGWVWSASHSQIYPELRRMEEVGLVAGDVEIRGTKLQKRVYSVTEAGLEELLRWVEEPLGIPSLRDPVALKAIFLDMGDDASAREHFRAYRAAMEKRLIECENWVGVIERREHPVLRIRLATLPPAEQDRMVAMKAHAFRRLIALTREEIRWAEEGLALLDRAGSERTPREAGSHRPRRPIPSPSYGS